MPQTEQPAPEPDEDAMCERCHKPVSLCDCDPWVDCPCED